MSRTLIARISACVLFITLACIAYWQPAYTQNNAPAKLKLNKVKDDLYEIEGDGGNVAVYITDEGVILIDDKFDQDHQGIVDQVKTVTNQPIKYILSTHHHSDHSGGNGKFLPTVEIISTANAHKNIVEHKQPGAESTMGGRSSNVKWHCSSHGHFLASPSTNVKNVLKRRQAAILACAGVSAQTLPKRTIGVW